MNLRRIWKLIQVRNREFFRDRSSLGWNFAFPILIVFGMAYSFGGGQKQPFKVALHKGSEQLSLAAQRFVGIPELSFVEVKTIEEALPKLRRHQYDLLISVGPKGDLYWVNEGNPKGALVERLLGGLPPLESGWERQVVEGRPIRYVDWVVAGVLGMNMMFSALFGVGYVIVRYRKAGVLKRLKASPVRPLEFLSAQVLSRLWILVSTTALVYGGTHALLHFEMLGSYATLALIFTVGGFALISLGVTVAARVASEEFAGGILNLLTWPMMFLSGVWFSMEGAHPFLQGLAKIFPLTHMIEAARAVMTEGATLAQVAPQIGLLAAMAVVFLSIGTVLFRWD
jgi:ABC-2 type transport system permease protein